MEYNLTQHLINLKVYSDFKRSGFSTFNYFIMHIEDGGNPFLVEIKSTNSETIIDPISIDEPDLDMCQLTNNSSNFDLVEQYLIYISNEINRILEYFPNTPDVFSLKNIESDIINKYGNIKDFLEADTSTIEEYTKVIGANNPSIFLDHLSSEEYLVVINENETNVSLSSEQSAKFGEKSYSHIFSNNGYILWNYLYDNFIAPKEKRGRYADISYFYWCLYDHEENYIHQRPEVFKNWFCDQYIDDFNKIKTKLEATDQKGVRNKDFSTALDWLKSTI